MVFLSDVMYPPARRGLQYYPSNLQEDNLQDPPFCGPPRHQGQQAVIFCQWRSEKQEQNNRKAITNRSNNVIYKLRTITIKINNGTNIPRAINNRNDNAS